MDLTGKILLNRYRVDAHVGHGGMAEVYKVWDSQRAAFLAMKLLREDLLEDLIFLRRFRREATVLEKLQHPHIVRFYGLEQVQEFTFILMDYVEGSTLRKEIFTKRQPFNPERILYNLRPVCSALHYAHGMGQVHCDIKPANVMLHHNGSVLVTDFGISRMTESTTMTMVGAGTPAYMAPEQVIGLDPTPQTDIYALGVVLYEMLTGGERPFIGEQAQTGGPTSEKVRWEQVHLDAPSLRNYNSSITPELEAVVLRCLAKQPQARYSSALALLEALESNLNVGEGEPAELQPARSVTDYRPASQAQASSSAPGMSVVTPASAQPAFSEQPAVSQDFAQRFDARQPADEQPVGQQPLSVQSLSEQLLSQQLTGSQTAVGQQDDGHSAAGQPTALESASQPAPISQTMTYPQRKQLALGFVFLSGLILLLAGAWYVNRTNQIAHNFSASQTAVAEVAYAKKTEQAALQATKTALQQTQQVFLQQTGHASTQTQQVFLQQTKSAATQTAAQINKVKTASARSATQTAVQVAKNKTATALAVKVKATAQSYTAMLQELTSSELVLTKLLAEIKQGELKHEEDSYVKTKEIDSGVSNFVLIADFVNPYKATFHDWDFGVIFRDKGGNDQYRLTIHSDRSWSLKNTTPGSNNFNTYTFGSGTIRNLFLGEGQSNQLILIALGKEGYLIVNGELIAKLNLSVRTASGGVSLAIGLYNGDEVHGKVTKYKNVFLYAASSD